MSVMQVLKDRLVALGPGSKLTQAALELHGRRHGFQISFTPTGIRIRRADHVMILRNRDFVQVPIMLEIFDDFCATIVPVERDGLKVLDFSAPGRHRYVRHDIELTFPGVPEDDAIPAYTHRFAIAPGMTVFDVGAHAGFTTCLFSRMVGERGRVFAFEPDNGNREYLEQNVRDRRLRNVTVVSSALSDTTGRALFNMDGSMGASLIDTTIYADTGTHVEVETITLEDFCRSVDMVPDYIKMDIEGAELGVVQSSAGFLREHPVHLAMETYHKMKGGGFTYQKIEPMLRQIGYEVASSSEFGHMFTWAAPRQR